MRTPALIFALVCSFQLQTSYAQQSEVHGTVLVFGHSKTKLIIATESRDEGKTRQLCKIIVLNGKTVFTAAGLAVHANPQVTYWNALAQAVYNFEKAKSTKNSSRLRNTAIGFGERFTKEVNQALRSDNKGSLEEIEGNKNTVITGDFLGFENNVAQFYEVFVTYDPQTQVASYQLRPKYNLARVVFGAAGENEVAIEFLKGETPFAKSEQAKWEMFKQGIPVKDRDVYLAMRLVELTIMYHPQHQTVGGAIDAMEITNAGIRWVQCKPQCQCNNKPLEIPPGVRERLDAE